MTTTVADRVWLVGAVNANASFVKGDPHDA
jgi:hypothetical protein